MKWYGSSISIKMINIKVYINSFLSLRFNLNIYLLIYSYMWRKFLTIITLIWFFYLILTSTNLLNNILKQLYQIKTLFTYDIYYFKALFNEYDYYIFQTLLVTIVTIVFLNTVSNRLPNKRMILQFHFLFIVFCFLAVVLGLLISENNFYLVKFSKTIRAIVGIFRHDLLILITRIKNLIYKLYSNMIIFLKIRHFMVTRVNTHKQNIRYFIYCFTYFLILVIILIYIKYFRK
jgi:hypothetical protein